MRDYITQNYLSITKYSLIFLAGMLLTVIISSFFRPAPQTTTPTVMPTALPDIVVPMSLNEQESIFGELYERAAPSVVSISYGLRFEDDFIFTSISSGSGFVITSDGYIVTNAHVLQFPSELLAFIEEEALEISETRVEVRMFDGTITDAEIIGIDLDSDIAVLQVDVAPELLRPIAFANSQHLRVGQTVLAIGNPFSNDWTMTSGIISALNRSIPGLEGFSIGGVIQTDTAINPGNSGGPLINLEGNVIGVNSQINSENGSNSGIGFAVPSNLVAKIATILIAHGEVEYSFIGIQSRPVDLDLINAFNLPNNLRGVAVLGTFEDTPAADAGVLPLSNDSVDVITAIDGVLVADFDELLGYLAINTVPGDSVTLTVYRAGQYLQLPLTLTSRPSLQADETEEPEAEQ